jgi:hypothetical protein
VISENMISEIDPVLQRPVFVVASAPWMKCDDRRVQPGEKFQGMISIFFRQEKFRRKIGNWEADFFDRLGKLSGRMRTIIDLGWAAKYFLRATPPQIVFKNRIRIVEIADYDVELCKVVCKLGRQIGIFGKESRKLRRFDRADSVGVKSLFGQNRNVFVSENFNVRVRMRVAQRLHCRQSQDEITDRATANHQEPIQSAKSVLGERTGKNGDAVNCGDAVNGVPARVAVRAPIDLVAQQIRHRHPEEAGQNEQIREHGQE